MTSRTGVILLGYDWMGGSSSELCLGRRHVYFSSWHLDSHCFEERISWGFPGEMELHQARLGLSSMRTYVGPVSAPGSDPVGKSPASCSSSTSSNRPAAQGYTESNGMAYMDVLQGCPRANVFDSALAHLDGGLGSGSFKSWPGQSCQWLGNIWFKRRGEAALGRAVRWGDGSSPVAGAQ